MFFCTCPVQNAKNMDTATLLGIGLMGVAVEEDYIWMSMRIYIASVVGGVLHLYK